MKYLVLSSFLLLAACSGTTHGITCPELKQYTEEEMLTAAMELSQSNDVVTQKMIADYMRTRDAIRVCQSWQESYR